MKAFSKSFVVYLWSFPWDIITWLMVLFIWLFWGTKLQWIEGLWCELKPRSWPCRTWYRIKIGGKHIINPLSLQNTHGKWITWNGTSFGHGGFYGPGRTEGPGIDTSTEFHEHIHTEQVEVAMFSSFIYGLFVFLYSYFMMGIIKALIPSLIIWTSGALILWISGWITALARGEKPYKGSQHEESAYTQTILHEEGK